VTGLVKEAVLTEVVRVAVILIVVVVVVVVVVFVRFVGSGSRRNIYGSEDDADKSGDGDSSRHGSGSEL
jgi:Na+/proline symporter